MQSTTNLLPGPLSSPCPVRVDDFTGRGALAYFLTHAHEDHLSGLRPGWSFGPIYCTAITQVLVLQRFPELDPALFVPLEVGQSKLVPELRLTVSVLDSKHCAGSCMFLLESAHVFGPCSVLHTGDFRFEHADDYPSVLAHKRNVCVYLDNTFGLALSPLFPPRQEVLAVLSEVLQGFSSSSTAFVFHIKGLGKEEVLVEAARALGTTACVTEERLAKIASFYPPGVVSKAFTTHGALLGSRVYCHPAQPEGWGEHVVHVNVTGWGGLEAFRELKALVGREGELPSSFQVPYSLHSNQMELANFIRHHRANFSWVVPTVHCTAQDRNELFVDQTKAPRSSWQPPPPQPGSGVLASPEQHAHRQLLKRTRLDPGRQDPRIRVVFRHTRSHAQPKWTREEDRVVGEMWKARTECSAHLLARQRLAHRTDMEIITRGRVLRQRQHQPARDDEDDDDDHNDNSNNYNDDNSNNHHDNEDYL